MIGQTISHCKILEKLGESSVKSFVSAKKKSGSFEIHRSYPGGSKSAEGDPLDLKDDCDGKLESLD